MPLEAVMIIVDNSESSRNGDYQPSRFDAQADAVNLIFQSVTSSNPESSVGLMTMGGKGPDVLTTLTTDRGKILDGLHRTRNKIRGSSHLWTSLQVAFLGLKHRQNRAQRQRIVAFVCSPPEQEARRLQELALKLKKNSVALDFVLFGDLEDDTTRKTLEEFIAKVKGDKAEGAELIVIPPSGKLLSDQLVGTAILLGDAAAGSSRAGGGGGMGGGEDFGEFDFDPAMEPELALALRMSIEEEKARQERVAREEEEAANKASLEAVKEEDEGEPLLDKDGKPAEGKKDDGDEDADKMDTA